MIQVVSLKFDFGLVYNKFTFFDLLTKNFPYTNFGESGYRLARLKYRRQIPG